MAIGVCEASKTSIPLIERVIDDREAVDIVLRKGNAVLTSADDYASWQEIAHLFGTPANMLSILDSFERAAKGDFEFHGLVTD
ncbi:type II toxin-antitoxin system Phd/YefM family antitoxin [Corynebacterium glutamicum]|uniref:type II toxin-antitoxin system Phd/YefM family antitoxin n=1 Tax=Corynebacterium glutamicum TaxID=1718 RepID=UPI000942C453|nr:prevent-host-death family protein [Corynebacterium glutamicum]OKX84280.1 prevent-host-death family protein [Corynebacterium glutamicum]